MLLIINAIEYILCFENLGLRIDLLDRENTKKKNNVEKYESDIAV